MPNIPVYHLEKKSFPEENKTEQKLLSTDEEIKLRALLVAQIKQPQGKENLEKIILENASQLSEEKAVLTDYALLHSAKEKEEKRHQDSELQEQLEEEALVICQVGAQADSLVILQAYLEAQLTVYQTHLEEFLLSKEEIVARLHNVRRNTEEACLLRALEEGNWKLAYQVLEMGKKDFSDEFQEDCRLKICQIFAEKEAEDLWERAREKFPQDIPAAMEWAKKQIPNPNESIGEQIIKDLIVAQQTAQREKAFLQAGILEDLAHESRAQALETLAGQTVFSGEELRTLYEICHCLEREKNFTSAARFMKCYFSGNKKENEKFYEQGHLSARDFLLLQAAFYNRQGGDDLVEEQWLLRRIEKQLAQKGFSEEEICRVQYEVLTSVSKDEAWQHIKNLLGL